MSKKKKSKFRMSRDEKEFHEALRNHHRPKYKGENREDTYGRLFYQFKHKVMNLTPIYDSSTLYKIQLHSLEVYLEYNECLSYSAAWRDDVRYIKLAIEMLNRILKPIDYEDKYININNVPPRYQRADNIYLFDSNPLKYKALRIYSKILLEKSLDWGD